MTKDTFYKAMLEIDDELVLDNIPRSFEANKKTKKARLPRILIPLAASLLVLAAVLVPFIARIPSTDRVLEPDPDAVDQREMTVGFDLSSGGKPPPRQRLALGAFCLNHKTVTVRASMGDSYGPLDAFDESGYPAFRVYVTEDIAWDTAISSPLSVNGGGSSYEHKFGRDDMESLDITGKADDFDSYYSESVLLDFTGFKAGDSGSIIFEFSWNHDPTDPETGSEKDFQRRPLYFYVGRNIVVFSFDSIEDAERIYTGYVRPHMLSNIQPRFDFFRGLL